MPCSLYLPPGEICFFSGPLISFSTPHRPSFSSKVNTISTSSPPIFFFGFLSFHLFRLWRTLRRRDRIRLINQITLLLMMIGPEGLTDERFFFGAKRSTFYFLDGYHLNFLWLGLGRSTYKWKRGIVVGPTSDHIGRHHHQIPISFLLFVSVFMIDFVRFWIE